MPAMKLTFNAAMRARDVSRPRAEHLAEAEATEARYADRPQARTGGAGKDARGAEKSGEEKTRTPRPTAAGDERAGRPGYPRRRRGRSSR